jgi:hypothetical protein
MRLLPKEQAYQDQMALLAQADFREIQAKLEKKRSDRLFQEVEQATFNKYHR